MPDLIVKGRLDLTDVNEAVRITEAKFADFEGQMQALGKAMPDLDVVRIMKEAREEMAAGIVYIRKMGEEAAKTKAALAAIKVPNVPPPPPPPPPRDPDWSSIFGRGTGGAKGRADALAEAAALEDMNAVMRGGVRAANDAAVANKSWADGVALMAEQAKNVVTESERMIDGMSRSGREFQLVSEGNKKFNEGLANVKKNTADLGGVFGITTPQLAKAGDVIQLLAIQSLEASGPIGRLVGLGVAMSGGATALIGVGVAVAGVATMYKLLGTAQREAQEENARLTKGLLDQANNALPAVERAARALGAALAEQQRVRQNYLDRLVEPVTRVTDIITSPAASGAAAGFEMQRRWNKEQIETAKAVAEGKKALIAATREQVTQELGLLSQSIAAGTTSNLVRQQAAGREDVLRQMLAATNLTILERIALEEKLTAALRARDALPAAKRETAKQDIVAAQAAQQQALQGEQVALKASLHDQEITRAQFYERQRELTKRAAAVDIDALSKLRSVESSKPTFKSTTEDAAQLRLVSALSDQIALRQVLLGLTEQQQTLDRQAAEEAGEAARRQNAEAATEGRRAARVAEVEFERQLITQTTALYELGYTAQGVALKQNLASQSEQRRQASADTMTLLAEEATADIVALTERLTQAQGLNTHGVEAEELAKAGLIVEIERLIATREKELEQQGRLVVGSLRLVEAAAAEAAKAATLRNAEAGTEARHASRLAELAFEREVMAQTTTLLKTGYDAQGVAVKQGLAEQFTARRKAAALNLTLLGEEAAADLVALRERLAQAQKVNTHGSQEETIAQAGVIRGIERLIAAREKQLAQQVTLATGNQKALEAAEKAQLLSGELASIGQFASAVGNTASAVGLIGENAAKSMQDVSNLMGTLAELVLTGASTGNVLAVIGAGGALLGGLLGDKGPSRSEMLIRELNQRLAELKVTLEGTLGAGALKVSADSLKGLFDFRKDFVPSGGGLHLPSEAAEVWAAQLEASGIAIEEWAARIEALTGFDVLDEEGRIIAETAEAARKAVEELIEASTRFGKSFDAQLQQVDVKNRIFGVKDTSQALSMKRDVLLANLELDPETEKRISNLNLATEEGRAAYLEWIQSLYLMAQAGEITAEQLHNIPNVTVLSEEIANQADTIAQAAEEAAQRIVDAAAREAEAREKLMEQFQEAMDDVSQRAQFFGQSALAEFDAAIAALENFSGVIPGGGTPGAPEDAAKAATIKGSPAIREAVEGLNAASAKDREELMRRLGQLLIKSQFGMLDQADIGAGMDQESFQQLILQLGDSLRTIAEEQKAAAEAVKEAARKAREEVSRMLDLRTRLSDINGEANPGLDLSRWMSEFIEQFPDTRSMFKGITSILGDPAMQEKLRERLIALVDSFDPGDEAKDEFMTFLERAAGFLEQAARETERLAEEAARLRATQAKEAELRGALAGDPQDAGAKFKREIERLTKQVPSFRKFFEGLDLSAKDPASKKALQARLLKMFDQFGDTDFTKLGIKRDEFIDFLTSGAQSLDLFNDQINDATKALLNFPTGINLLALEFEAQAAGASTLLDARRRPNDGARLPDMTIQPVGPRTGGRDLSLPEGITIQGDLIVQITEHETDARTLAARILAQTRRVNLATTGDPARARAQ